MWGLLLSQSELGIFLTITSQLPTLMKAFPWNQGSPKFKTQYTEGSALINVQATSKLSLRSSKIISKGCSLFELQRSGLAPFYSNVFTRSSWPFLHAAVRGVYLSKINAKNTHFTIRISFVPILWRDYLNRISMHSSEWSSSLKLSIESMRAWLSWLWSILTWDKCF